MLAPQRGSRVADDRIRGRRRAVEFPAALRSDRPMPAGSGYRLTCNTYLAQDSFAT